MRAFEQIRRAENAMRGFDPSWGDPVCRSGIWYASPVGFNYGFIVSPSKKRVEENLRAIIQQQEPAARRLIWC